MLRFESLGPTLIDCEGCSNYIAVYVEKPENEVNNNEDKSKKIKKMTIIDRYIPMAEKIKNMEVYDDDIWVMSYPKCGTTWTQEMTWLINNNLDYETARKIDLSKRFPFLELSGLLNNYPPGSEEVVFNAPRPRHIKSHLTVELLPDKMWTSNAKIIYVTRNPKDAALSFYHHYKNLVGYQGSKEDFFDSYMDAKIIYAPFHDHVLGFWEIRDNPKILFLVYEDMKADLMPALKKVSKFLGKSYTDEQLLKLADHLSVENMRKNPSCNNEVHLNDARKYHEANYDENYKFIRKGKAGAFKEEISEEYIKKFDKWTEDNLQGTDFKFRC
uniref:CSON003751 protein n=1 Tax=Culicoides sonorensis TaxID=179676 RepID=A0A336MTB3_CULSO